MGYYKLVIILKDRVISIPFRRKLKDIDEFTVGYSNHIELGEALNEILDLKINSSEITNIYLSYQYGEKEKDTGEGKERYIPIKYQSDNFDYRSVLKVYTRYLCDDRSRIMEEHNGIKEVALEYINRSQILYMKDMDIEKIVSLCFKDSYKRYRDAYFKIKKKGYTVRIKDLNVNPKMTDNQDDANYDMQIVSYKTLDESNEERMITLEKLAGMSIDRLVKLVELYQEDYKSGRKR